MRNLFSPQPFITQLRLKGLGRTKRAKGLKGWLKEQTGETSTERKGTGFCGHTNKESRMPLKKWSHKGVA